MIKSPLSGDITAIWIDLLSRGSLTKQHMFLTTLAYDYHSHGSSTREHTTPFRRYFARRVRATLAISPLLVRDCLFMYGIVGFMLTHDEVCGQIKGPRSAGQQSVRSLIDIDGDTTPRLLSRASHPPGLSFIIFNPKSGIWPKVHLFRCWTHQGLWQIHHQVLFLKTFPPTEASLLF